MSGFVLVEKYVPHTHHSAGSCSDNSCWIGTGGAQRLAPVTQTLTKRNGLETDTQEEIVKTLRLCIVRTKTHHMKFIKSQLFKDVLLLLFSKQPFH